VDRRRHAVALAKAVNEARHAEECCLMRHGEHAAGDDHPVVAKSESEEIHHLPLGMGKQPCEDRQADERENQRGREE
jgi:hypothetical protein